MTQRDDEKPSDPRNLRRPWTEGPDEEAPRESWLSLGDDELLHRVETLPAEESVDDRLIEIIQSSRHFFIRQEAAKRVRDRSRLFAFEDDRHIGQILVRYLTRREDVTYLERLVSRSRHVEVRAAAQVQLAQLWGRLGGPTSRAEGDEAPPPPVFEEAVRPPELRKPTAPSVPEAPPDEEIEVEVDTVDAFAAGPEQTTAEPATTSLAETAEPAMALAPATADPPAEATPEVALSSVAEAAAAEEPASEPAPPRPEEPTPPVAPTVPELEAAVAEAAASHEPASEPAPPRPEEPTPPVAPTVPELEAAVAEAAASHEPASEPAPPRPEEPTPPVAPTVPELEAAVAEAAASHEPASEPAPPRPEEPAPPPVAPTAPELEAAVAEAAASHEPASEPAPPRPEEPAPPPVAPELEAAVAEAAAAGEGGTAASQAPEGAPSSGAGAGVDGSLLGWAVHFLVEQVWSHLDTQTARGLLLRTHAELLPVHPALSFFRVEEDAHVHVDLTGGARLHREAVLGVAAWMAAFLSATRSTAPDLEEVDVRQSTRLMADALEQVGFYEAFRSLEEA